MFHFCKMWFLLGGWTNPFEKNSSSHWIHVPPFSGWTLKSIETTTLASFQTKKRFHSLQGCKWWHLLVVSSKKQLAWKIIFTHVETFRSVYGTPRIPMATMKKQQGIGHWRPCAYIICIYVYYIFANIQHIIHTLHHISIALWPTIIILTSWLEILLQKNTWGFVSFWTWTPLLQQENLAWENLGSPHVPSYQDQPDQKGRAARRSFFPQKKQMGKFEAKNWVV